MAYLDKPKKFIPTWEQKAAIEHHEGPAVVFAGPGSGKTEVIARRVTNLILGKEIKADSIVLTTFTNKATDELRTRMQKVLCEYLSPQEAGIKAASLTIGTIHSLCNKILREFGFKREATARPVFPATDQDQILFLNRYYNNFELREFYARHKNLFYSGRGEPFSSFILDLAAGLNTMAEEIDRPELGRSFSNKEIKDSYLKGLVSVYGKYRVKLKELHRLDYSLLLSETAKVLHENPEIVQLVRQKWPYALVDEYQDTSLIQDEIFRIVYGNDGNIMVVGDDDQSIYRFRGADSTSFLEFPKNYPTAVQYVLSENRRSTPQIIKSTKALIGGNKRRRDKDLKAAEGNPGGQSPIHLHEPKKDKCAETVIKWLKKLKDEGTITQYRQAAVFCYSTSKYRKELVKILKAEGIPYQLDSDKHFLQEGIAKAFIGLMTECSKNREKLEKARTLDGRTVLCKAFNELGVDKDEKLRVAEALHWHDRLDKPEKSDNLLKIFYQFIDKYDLMGANQPAMGPKALGRLSTLIASYEEGRKATAFQLPATMLEEHAKIEEQISEYDSSLLENNDDGRRYKGWLQKRMGFFLRYLNMLRLSNEPDLHDDSLLITTIHKAKGLEFDVVAVLGANQRSVVDSEEAGTCDKLRETFLEQKYNSQFDREEKRRLLYVACTRARRILLVGSDGNGPSNLISDMGIDTISSSELLKVRPRIVAPKAITSKDVLRLSHGEVFAYLDCPKRYELEHQHEFKGITTSALRLGGALHRAIENAHRWQIIGDLSHFDDDKLIEIFKQTWPFPIREETDSKQYKKYEALYLNYFKDPSSLKRETISVENDLTVIRGENILTGKLDVAQRGTHDETVIVEIKLSYNRANQKRAENQLNVYALAFPDRDLALEAVYLKGQRGTQRHKVKQGDCKELAEQVEFAFGKVRGKEFKADPEGEKCRQCRMSKICHEGKEIITKKAA